MFRTTAHVYDLIYRLEGKNYEAESAVLADEVRQRVPSAQTLLDVGCGTGGHLVHLASRFDVAGLDLDPGMLAEARRRLPKVELIEADMIAFDLGRVFDSVVCLFSSIGYLPDQLALHTAVARMAAHVATRGVLIVDGWVLPERWRDSARPNVVSGIEDGVTLARVTRTERHGNRTHLEMHHLVGTTAGVQHLVDHHELTLFAESDYVESFRAAGLDVEVVVGPSPDRNRYIGTRSQH